MNELGIERLGTFGMPPAEMAALAADLGADCIGIGLVTSSTYNPDGYRRYSLREAVQRRETVAACRDRNVRVSIVEGFAILPDNDVRALAGDLDIVRELGCDRINVVSICPGLERTIEGFQQLCEIAAERGIKVSAEMGSLGPLKQVCVAQEIARSVNQPNFSLVIDSMHFFRLGNSVADFTVLDPTLIGYIQLADAPWKPRFETYMEEAMFERMVPGEGELPLAEFVRHIPDGVAVSVEVPIRSRAEAGLSVRERTAPCLAAAKALLRQASSRL